MSFRAWILLLVLASLWGASYLFIKVGLRDLSPAEIAVARTALGAVVLIPFVIARGAVRPLLARWQFITALGALQVAGPFILINVGEQHISSSLTAILVASTPLFTALMAIGILRSERPTARGAFGLAMGLVGVALIVGVDLSGDAAAVAGGAMVLLGAAGYALGALMVKRSASDLDPLGIAAGTLVVSTVMCAVPAAFTLSDHFPSLAPLLATAALGVLGTGRSFAIWYTLIAEVGPVRSSLVTYIVPAFAVVYGVSLLHETVTPGAAAGLVLVLLGSWLTAGGLAREPAPAEALSQ
jgi:drug/metabolite transporter (DMT)-like permease